MLTHLMLFRLLEPLSLNCLSPIVAFSIMNLLNNPTRVFDTGQCWTAVCNKRKCALTILTVIPPHFSLSSFAVGDSFLKINAVYQLKAIITCRYIVTCKRLFMTSIFQISKYSFLFFLFISFPLFSGGGKHILSLGYLGTRVFASYLLSHSVLRSFVPYFMSRVKC